MIVKLINNKGFKWFCRDYVYVKGYLCDRNNRLYKNEKLLDYFGQVQDENSFQQCVLNANGCFAAVIIRKGMLLAAVDRMRSMPIFYGVYEGELALSDSPFYLYSLLSESAFDEISFKEFILTGYVTGNHTLSPKIMQLRAGEYLAYYYFKNKMDKKQYFQFNHGGFSELKDEERLAKMDELHLEVFNRLIDSLSGRTAVVPLSGGYDSRLAVVMLKRLGYKNIICYSYGLRGNSESAVSNKIARALGCRWLFIEYSQEKWRDFFCSSERRDYYRFGCGLSSNPHLQDFLAVNEIRRKELVPCDSVFIPGHSYDFLQGSHIPENIIDRSSLSNIEVINYIFDCHYCLHNWENDRELLEKSFIERIKYDIGEQKSFSREEAANAFELWDWQERQAKFICNSVRAYEYFDYEWRLPFWDNAAMHYWSSVPLDKRLNRSLYRIYNDTFCSSYVLHQGRSNGILLKAKDINAKEENKYLRKIKHYLIEALKKIRVGNLYRMAYEIKKKKNKIDYKKIYNSQPLGIYGVLSMEEFIENYTGAENVNSLLSKKFVKEIKND